jgi:hypothetical protein
MARILAIKNGNERFFSEQQWKRMPASKYGWQPVLGKNSPTPKPEEIIQKKIVPESVAENIKPEEIIGKIIPQEIKKDIPEEKKEIKRGRKKSK